MPDPFDGAQYEAGRKAGRAAAERGDVVRPCPNLHRDFRSGFEVGHRNFFINDDYEATCAEERFGC